VAPDKSANPAAKPIRIDLPKSQQWQKEGCWPGLADF